MSNTTPALETIRLSLADMAEARLMMTDALVEASLKAEKAARRRAAA